jgi:hypothetical protein
MYSWEIDQHLKNINYTFDNFYSFNKIIQQSPQTKYCLIKEYKDKIRLDVFTSDNYKWQVYVIKETLPWL